jgi:hypothetical protein
MGRWGCRRLRAAVRRLLQQGDLIFVEAKKMSGLLRFVFALRHLTQKGCGGKSG